MQTIFIDPSNMESVLKKYLGMNNSIFVYSSNIASDSWSDWAVKNPELSGVQAVELDRFTAWDKFKKKYVISNKENKTIIPAVLRKLFVRSLIKENALLCKKGSPLFKRIICPEYAQSAYTFTDWIAKLILSLELWYRKYMQFSEKKVPDDEDSDYLCLYKKYSAFLEQNNFIEPSWLPPEFSEKDNVFIIFYPEIIEDFISYKETFEKSDNIILVCLPENKNIHNVKKYPDSRTEIRKVILKIRELNEQKKADWTEIALNVSDIDTLRPYLVRELKKYCVPFVMRSGVSLVKNSAGVIFNEIKECVSSDFSYESLRSLLQTQSIPWKETVLEAECKSILGNFKILKENLICEGNRMKCICGFEEENSCKKIDIWEEALKNVSKNERELIFYKNLKNDINKIYFASSFKGIREAWFIFKERYLDKNGFSPESDKIISRCISVLSSLAEIEQKYIVPMKLDIEEHYGFFLNELNSTIYQPQEKINGISIFPYRLAAQAQFKYQFVIDSSQKQLEVRYKRLAFLDKEKRKVLHVFEEDRIFNAGKAFISLYGKGNCFFSYAEKSFSGFAINYNFLNVNSCADFSDTLDKDDFIKAANNFFLKNGNYKIERLTQAQKDSFNRWTEISKQNLFLNDTEYSLNKNLEDKINYVLKEKRSRSFYKNPCYENNTDCIKITQSDMKNFFPCPRKWIFKNVLNVKEISLVTDLMEPYTMGTINHKIIEMFMKEWKNQGKNLPVTCENGIFEEENEILKIIEECTFQVINSDKTMSFFESPLVKITLNAQKKEIAENILNFFHKMCVCSEEKGFGGSFIKHIEKWFSLPSENSLWEYSGKIDCILCDDEGNPSIIDYKNTDSSVPSISSCIADKNTGELNDFQIPMYVTLWNLGENGNIPVKNALFYSIKNGKQRYIIEGSKKTNRGNSVEIGEYKKTLESFEEYANKFYQKIQSAQFIPCSNKNDIYNNTEPFSVCVSCDFKSICRTVYSLSGRKIKISGSN